MSTNYNMTREEARTKVYFICSCCGKEKWTLKMNFKDGQKCPSCKRKEKLGDFLNSDEFKQKRKETLIKKYGSLENSKKAIAEKSKQTKLLKRKTRLEKVAKFKSNVIAKFDNIKAHAKVFGLESSLYGNYDLEEEETKTRHR